jgi:hypothetical protein
MHSLSDRTVTSRSQTGRFFCSVLLAAQLLGVGLVTAAERQVGGQPGLAKKAEPIPPDQIGAAVAKQYSGDGLAVLPTPEGARLRCAFQKMEGEATREGLWLTSTAEGANGDKFRVVAAAVARNDGPRSVLPATGKVEVKEQLVRFLRPGLVEEYSVSVDGVRQDFIVESRPAGAGQLRVELAVSGAQVESLLHGVRLVLGGRELNYSRLKVTDANGKELFARMEVTGQSETQNPKSEPSLAVLVDDTEAAYPIRIDPTFSDANWVSMGGILGVNGVVRAALVDGFGNLYIGGSFTIVGGVFATNIARWNGTDWSALGAGLGGGQPYLPTVYALAASGNDVYVGGWFTTAGGTAATNIAKWNGSAWSALGVGVNGYVYALATLGNDVYAGGWFGAAGGIAANQIAKWDGSTWSALGSGMNHPVHALVVSGNDLFAGGNFTTAGGVMVNRTAKWSGNTWSALGSGMNDGSVVALTVFRSDVYAAGVFTNAGGVAANRIAKWNGSDWSALGSGMNLGFVYALAVLGDELYAGGSFTNAGGAAANRIAKWNGTAWSTLGSGTDGYVYALAVVGSDLYVGGDFKKAGGGLTDYLAKWDGSAWSALGSGIGGGHGFYPIVLSLAVSDTNVYAGGNFTRAGGGTANYIAKWNGSVWSELGSGMNNTVSALAVSGSDLYAGGNFTNAGGVAANRIAKWNGMSWSALGSGMDNRVSALAVSGSNVYVGGWFTNAGGVAANYIAKWNGSVWSALGSGLDGSVYSLAVSGSDVYAGGYFSSAGGSTANSIAKWNGSSWSALGPGVAGYDGRSLSIVGAIALSGSIVYVAGLPTASPSGTATLGVRLEREWAMRWTRWLYRAVTFMWVAGSQAPVVLRPITLQNGMAARGVRWVRGWRLPTTQIVPTIPTSRGCIQ